MLSPFSSKAPSTYRLISFATELSRNGHNVCIILPSSDRHSDFVFESNDHVNRVRLIRPYQLTSRNFEVSMAPYFFSSIFKTLSQRFDVVHILKTSPLTCAGYVTKFFYRSPVVQDIDDLDHLVMIAEKHPKVRVWIVKQFERFLPKVADQIITSSSLLRKMYLDIGIEEERIAWVPNGVSVSEFDVEGDMSLKARYNLRGKVIVYVGSLNNEAQLSPLLTAMRFVVKEREDTSCLIIGDGTARQSLECLTHDLKLEDYVIFAGKVVHKEVPKLLSICDVGFACFQKMNYISAASNIKVFEYMASGIPVVVSATGDLPHYIEFGKAGVIANVDSLSNSLLDLLTNDKKRKRLGEHARRYVTDNFDWRILTEKLEKIYKKANSIERKKGSKRTCEKLLELYKEPLNS